MKNAVIFFFTDKGCLLNGRVSEILSRSGYSCRAITTEKLAGKHGFDTFTGVSQAVGEAFQIAEAIYLLGLAE